MNYLSNLFLGFVLVASILTGCETFTRYGQDGEKVYLEADSIPSLTIPPTLNSTAKLQDLYPIPEGPRRQFSEGAFVATPPQMLSTEELTEVAQDEAAATVQEKN